VKCGIFGKYYHKEKALPYVQELVELAPGAPGPDQLVKQIQEKMEAGKMQVR
jgi:hypothetical protein